MCKNSAATTGSGAWCGSGNYLCFFHPLYLFHYRRAGRIPAPGPYVNLFAPQCGASRADQKYKIVAEPHTICGTRSALFTLRHFVLRIFYVATPSTCSFFNCAFYFIFSNCNFYFILCLAIYSLWFYYAPFIHCIYCNVYYMCPRLFAPAHHYSFLTFSNPNLNHLNSTVFFIQEPYWTAPTVAVLWYSTFIQLQRA
jgi:hypothetical protein